MRDCAVDFTGNHFMSVPFLPLFNFNSGLPTALPGASGTSNAAADNLSGESFGQAMARLQNKGRALGEGDIPTPVVLSASGLDVPLDFTAELSSGVHIYLDGAEPVTLVDAGLDQESLLAPHHQHFSDDLGDIEGHLEPAPEAWPFIPGLIGPQWLSRPVEATDLGEQPVLKAGLGEGLGLANGELSSGLLRTPLEQRPPLAASEPTPLVLENPGQGKPMLGPTDPAAFKVALGESGKFLGESADSFEGARLGEEQKMATADLKAVLHAERGVSAPGPAAEGGKISVPVHVTFGLPQWATQVAERTAMLAGQNIQQAELKLDPPELGPLNVRISVNQEQASVHFVSANASVREALDQSVARLRELLQEQGLDLVDTGVSDQSQRDDSPKPSQGESSLAGGLDSSEEEADGSAGLQSATLSSGIDDFV